MFTEPLELALICLILGGVSLFAVEDISWIQCIIFEYLSVILLHPELRIPGTGK